MKAPVSGGAPPFVDEPKEYGLAIEWKVEDDLFGMVQWAAGMLAKEAKRLMDEETAHVLDLHPFASQHPWCRRCNPPAPYVSTPRDECQTWTEGEISVTRHVGECTCHDECYDY